MAINVDNFDWQFYLTYYPDLKTAGIDTSKKALDHYLLHGYKEKRLIHSDSLHIPSNLIPNRSSLIEVNSRWVQMLIDYIGQTPDQKLLEVGCGKGLLINDLMALMTGCHYYGCDLDHKNVEWCRQNHPKDCYFQSIRVSRNHHQYYGLYSQKSLPYESGHFDLIVVPILMLTLTSLQVRHYLAEISRILKIGGVCVISYLMWNPAIKNNLNLKHVEMLKESVSVQSLNGERAMAYHEHDLIQWHESYRLSINEIVYGSWSGNVNNKIYQDVVISRKIK